MLAQELAVAALAAGFVGALVMFTWAARASCDSGQAESAYP
jgi:hypothetical protein